MSLESELYRACEILAHARVRVAFTGAGVSAESGIPTFRGENGLWQEVSPEEFGTPWGILEVLRTSPTRFLKLIRRISEIVLNAQPNPAHITLAEWERLGVLKGVVTQNVDDLHEAGGTRTLYKLHGDLYRWRCLGCGEVQRFQRNHLKDLVHNLTHLHHLSQLLELLPRCSFCSGWLRPDVVLFGETLPPYEVAGALALLKDCDALLIVGSSGVVEPAAGMARRVAECGGTLIEINLEPGAFTPYCEVHLFGPCGEILPRLFRLLKESFPHTAPEFNLADSTLPH